MPKVYVIVQVILFSDQVPHYPFHKTVCSHQVKHCCSVIKRTECVRASHLRIILILCRLCAMERKRSVLDSASDDVLPSKLPCSSCFWFTVISPSSMFLLEISSGTIGVRYCIPRIFWTSRQKLLRFPLLSITSAMFCLSNTHTTENLVIGMPLIQACYSSYHESRC